MEHKGTRPIETARLTLRRFTIEDVVSVHCNWCSDPRVTRFLTWQAHEDLRETLNMVATWVESYDKLDYYQWAIVPKDFGEVVGSISVVEIKEQTDTVHIGYCIGAPWWGKGIATEALAGILPFLFEEVEVKRVDSRHDPENIGSGKVMEKCGLRYEGTLRQWDWNNRGIVDAAYYSLLEGEYEEGVKRVERVKYRLWREEDLATLKDLWKKAFFDEDEYIENFFAQFTGLFYVAEELGQVIGMTAVFDSRLHRLGRCHKMGYLYAVATHPDHRSRGIASGLLAHLYGDLREQGYEGVTTVPAKKSLFAFFGGEGFSTYFQCGELGEGADFSKMEPISAKEYVIRREEILGQVSEEKGLAYITLEQEGYEYQATLSAMGKGGLYWDGTTLMAVEGEESLLVKECLSLEKATCPRTFQGSQVWLGRGLPFEGETVDFGMIQWLVKAPQDWTEAERGYLGFGFD